MSRAELPSVGRYPPLQRWVAYPIMRAFATVLFWILGPVHCRGSYRIPRSGPVLIIANHKADVDPIVLQICCRRPIQFMAKSELFEIPILGRAIRWLRVFPVKRGEPDRAAMRHAVETLKIGEVVAVFPEGQLSEDGELQELKPGVALIVRQAASDESPLPVICCGIRNTDKVMPYGRVVPRISWTRVLAEWGEVREFARHSRSEEIMEWIEGQLRVLTSAD